ncbi:uncharacterized protein LOC143367317 isoform X1 [Andrena cerasifolii]|uniref:uncharacterized protein LOC143367317 isoform X1 n=1 Tax=Andrena cerasifolii TaxID=2819439 RepID=UPI004037F056
MAPELRSHCSKSTLDIFDDIQSDEDHLSAEDRYRTYTLEDLKEKKNYFAKERGRRQESSSQKSQSFVKKMIASLERKNEICKADDEFLTKYYSRNDYSDPNSYLNERHASFPADRNSSQNFKREPDSKNTVGEFRDSKITEWSRSENRGKNCNAKELILGHTRKKEETFETDEKRSSGYPKSLGYSQISKELHSQSELNKQHGSSSFDPNRVEIPKHVGSLNSCFLKKNKDDRKRDTLDRIFRKKEKDVTLGGNERKKLDRRSSFKDFLGHLIRRKKSECKEKPRRFMSYDQLAEEAKAFESKNVKKLSRTSSLHAVVFEDRDEENSTWGGERNATIRPVYGGRRNEQFPQVLTKRKEFRKFSATNESVENLVEPYAIRDIVNDLCHESY